MPIEICTIGGFEEIGRNMTAVKVDDTVVILDMGLHLPNYIHLTEDEDVLKLDKDQLYQANACPLDHTIDDWKKMVKLIIPSHAHLDHIGAIPYLAANYRAPILCTPFTGAVINTILQDEKIRLPNPIKTINVNSTFMLNEDVKVEFISVTHSTPHAVMVALHTKYGIILYANDYKFDNTPTLGRKPNYKALEKLGDKGVLVAIVESLYADDEGKTPSEAVAKAMLKDVMLGTNSKGHAMILTTFSSHLARLKSIVEFGKQLGRKVVFLGRSLAKYTYAGKDANVINFADDIEIVKYGSKIKTRLRQIEKEGKEKYLLVVTGHQGEPRATLSKMATGQLPFSFDKEDMVVFSCTVIPAETNKEYRELLESQLRQKGVRIYKDVHASGHASREDHRNLFRMIKPKHVIPSHAEHENMELMQELASEVGISSEQVHLMKNGQRLQLP